MELRKRKLKVGEWVVGVNIHNRHFGGFIISINKKKGTATVVVTGGEINLDFIGVNLERLWSAEAIYLDLDELEELMEIALKMRDYRWCRRLTKRKRIYMYYEGLMDEV
jgi:hypothetical protein